MGEPYQLLIDETQTATRMALCSGGCLLEYHQESRTRDSLVGDVILGRVERVLPDVKAAFVRIGQPLNGFLPLKEADSYHRTMGNASLMTGQEILVQVKKDPKGGKGAFLTRDITLPGQYGLLMPCNRFIGLSKRIVETGQRERAKALGTAVARDRFGLIVRHAALFASEEEVREEAERLWQTWQKLSAQSSNVKAPAVLHREASQAEILVRDYSARHSLETVYQPHAWQSARIDEQVQLALRRRVELAHGGSLVIDEREALHTIDVNSGKTVKADNGHLPLEENLRAVPEIARQIRLRNLSGIILIDFIDMDGPAQQEQVMQAMMQAVSDDCVKTVIHGFTRLGLLEMTRKRTRDTLRDLLTIPCTACRETGRVFAAE